MAEIATRVYRGDRNVTSEEWARCWRLFGPWVPERGRGIVNSELNAPGLELMRRFDVLDQLAKIKCSTLVCVGSLDPITPVAASREIVEALAAGVARLEVIEGAGHFTWRDRPDRYWTILTEFVRRDASSVSSAMRERGSATRGSCTHPRSNTSGRSRPAG